MSQVVTSSQYLAPHRPLLVRAYNRVRSAPLRDLSAPSLLERAERATGLHDFGDAAFREPLERLLAAVAREARLHPLGAWLLAQRFGGMLQNRLRLEALYRAHPEIENLPVARPIVIAGLQRTGTTLLHRLLAADPRARALLSWEALNPVPLPGEGRHGSRKRRLRGKLAERGLAGLAPEFFAIHPVEANAPEEDILLLDHTFATQTPEATLRVPSYAAWLERQDLTFTYHYLARMLRALSWQRGGSHWVLKTPHHMEHLDSLLRVFPSAIVVQTHRDPQATLASFCSMVAHGRAVFSDHVAPREIGRHWLRKVQRMLDRTQEARRTHGAQFIDVHYEDLLKDPLAQVRRIYRFAQLELPQRAEDPIRAAKAQNRQHRFGTHRYAIWDFGLSPRDVQHAFASYCQRHNVGEARRTAVPAAAQAQASGLGHRTKLRATVTALVDLRSHPGALPPLDASISLSGQAYLVTGATQGLGRAVAVDLARRGARVLGTGRHGLAAARAQIAAESANPNVELLPLDLADLDAVARFCDRLGAEKLDAFIANAGFMPSRPGLSKQGYESMFAVHYLANHLLVRRLLRQGNLTGPSRLPRAVFVASETHRSAPALDLKTLGRPLDSSAKDTMLAYGSSKLALLTFTQELTRRTQGEQRPKLGVHALCPGAIASRIAREAPPIAQPLTRWSMDQAFPSPAEAAKPVCYLAAAPELSGETGWYLHRRARKLPAETAADPAAGRALWDFGEAALAPWLA